MTTNPTPVRGEVWRIRFDPAEGDEIKKVRTAVIISENAVGRLRLKIVVPITEWKPKYANYPWFVYLVPTPTNGLTKDSGADAFQVKSVSETRFLTRLGELLPGQLDDIANTILRFRLVSTPTFGSEKVRPVSDRVELQELTHVCTF